MPDRERKGAPEHRSSVLKDLSLRVLMPILGTRKMRVSAAEGRERRRVEMK